MVGMTFVAALLGLGVGFGGIRLLRLLGADQFPLGTHIAFDTRLALVALAGGGYGVEVLDGSASRYLRVETGLFAAGRVEVTGDGIAEGMTVGMPK
jgi:hypothetical protein